MKKVEKNQRVLMHACILLRTRPSEMRCLCETFFVFYKSIQQQVINRSSNYILLTYADI